MVHLLLTIPFVNFAQGEKILSKHLHNYGQETWSQIETLKISGKHVTSDYEAFPLEVLVKENNQIRVEGINRYKGYTLALDHQVFWSTGSPEEVQPLEKLILQHAIAIGSPLAKFQSELKYYGLEIFDGKPLNSFKRETEGFTVTYFLDKENNELRHITIVTMDKEPISATLTIDKYKSHHGLLMPTAINLQVEDQYYEWVFDEILLGIAIDHQLFVRPNNQ
ncbi:MAG: hypothetical protein ACFHWX_20500 [Bacteroidota bacterium]